MSDSSDRPIGIPGAGLPSTPPLGGLGGLGGGTQTGGPMGGPSLRKPVFEAPAPARLPEGDVGAMVLATWGARFGAQILDGIIRMFIALLLAFAIFALFVDQPFDTTMPADPDGASHLGWLFVSAFGIYFLTALLYAPVTMSLNGGSTLGKRAAGIRVVSERGVPLGFAESALREVVFKGVVVGGIGGALVLPALLNYLWPLWDDQSRAGHDFMARTRVVRRDP